MPLSANLLHSITITDNVIAQQQLCQVLAKALNIDQLNISGERIPWQSKTQLQSPGYDILTAARCRMSGQASAFDNSTDWSLSQKVPVKTNQKGNETAP